MREALEEAKRGVAAGEAPIGCVIARGEGDDLRIVARGHNEGNARQQPTAHAEIMAFANAGCAERSAARPAARRGRRDFSFHAGAVRDVPRRGDGRRNQNGSVWPESACRQRHNPREAAGKPGRVPTRRSQAIFWRRKAAACLRTGCAAKRIPNRRNS